MAGYKVQCNYDDIGKAAQTFAKESQQTRQLFQQAKGVFGQLQGGDWIGVGAQKFFEEMENLVFPGLERLINTLQDASDAAKKVSDALKQAEEEASSLFR